MSDSSWLTKSPTVLIRSTSIESRAKASRRITSDIPGPMLTPAICNYLILLYDQITNRYCSTLIENHSPKRRPARLQRRRRHIELQQGSARATGLRCTRQRHERARREAGSSTRRQKRPSSSPKRCLVRINPPSNPGPSGPRIHACECRELLTDQSRVRAFRRYASAPPRDRWQTGVVDENNESRCGRIVRSPVFLMQFKHLERRALDVVPRREVRNP